MHGLEARYGGCVDFVYIDIDNPASDAVKARLGYRAQPEFYLVDASGNVQWKQYGYVTEQELEAQLLTAAMQ